MGANHPQSLVYIYFVSPSVCPFVSNKGQNSLTDRTNILCWASHEPCEGLWMLKIKKKLRPKFLDISSE